MKRLSTIFLVVLTVAFSACNSDDVVPQDCFEVKLVDSYCTGDAVLQIITPAAQAFGESWTNYDDITYDNVFRTMLPCGFELPGKGEVFSVSLTNNDDEIRNCVRCLMLVTGLPEKFSHISLSSDCNNPAD